MGVGRVRSARRIGKATDGARDGSQNTCGSPAAVEHCGHCSRSATSPDRRAFRSAVGSGSSGLGSGTGTSRPHRGGRAARHDRGGHGLVS